jgi:hypothetical protein
VYGDKLLPNQSLSNLPRPQPEQNTCRFTGSATLGTNNLSKTAPDSFQAARLRITISRVLDLLDSLGKDSFGILHGSIVERPLKWQRNISDVDVIIVSDIFENVFRVKRPRYMRERFAMPEDWDVTCLTQREYKSTSYPLRERMVIMHG